MIYLCPNCGRTMQCISTLGYPPVVYYRCDCGFKSKLIQEKPQCAYLPIELWAEEGEDEIQPNR